ncbi:MAG: YceI family protein [Paludibacter sp.]
MAGKNMFLTGFFVNKFYLCVMKRQWAILLVLIFSQYLIGQTIVTVELQKSSSLTIHGSTNLSKFKLIQSGEKMQRKAQNSILTQVQNRINLSQNQFPVALKNFSSDNIVALRGFLNLMRWEEYPNIIIQLNYFQIQAAPDKTQATAVKANLNFTITGVTKTYNIPISATSTGNQYHIDGNLNINIRDFGLEPPVTMMGLIKANEWINVDFHLNFKITIV